MALILAAPASGKTTFVKRNAGSTTFVDGDDLIPIPKERPDPADWTPDERQTHMYGFQTHIINNPGSIICVGFSEVCIDSFNAMEIPTVIVDIPKDNFNENVIRRHQNLRKGCNPRSQHYYDSQRVYLRNLASAHGLRIYTSFASAVDALSATLPYYKSPAADNTDAIKRTIARDGFCIVPNLLPRGSRLGLEMKRSALCRSGTALSNHLSGSPAASAPNVIPLKDTIHQFLNPHLQHDVDKTTFHIARSLLSFMDALLDIKEADGHAYLFNDTLLTKTKDHKYRLHWHQDFSFWPLHINSQVLVVWIPLVPVQKDNGALSVAIGSHCCQVGPIINLSTGIPDEASSHKGHHLDFDKDGSAITLELNAGDGIIFHPNLFHMSHPNRSENTRVAWSSVWAHPDAQWDPSRVPRHPRSKEVAQGAKLGQFEWERDIS